MIDLNQVMTFSEAAEKWGLANGNTLRKAVERKRFQPDEIRKSGDVWLTTYRAMARVFGQPRQSDMVVSMENLSSCISEAFYNPNCVDQEFNNIFKKMKKTIEMKKTITIITSDHQPEKIIMIIKDDIDFENFKTQLNRYLQSISVHL